MICSVWIQKWIQFWIILLVFAVKSSFQHARLMEPPSRASMWRVGFPTPRDVDDNQSYCGGYGVQYGTNGGKCGICGDPWHENPRAHEAPGGIYATGIIVKTYKQVKGKLCYLSSPTVKSSKSLCRKSQLPTPSIRASNNRP